MIFSRIIFFAYKSLRPINVKIIRILWLIICYKAHKGSANLLPYISDHKAAKCQKIHLKKAYNPCKASVAITIKIINILAIYFGTVEPAIFNFFYRAQPRRFDQSGVFCRCYVWRWCDVSSATKHHNSTTSRSYWELHIWACWCWWGDSILDVFRMPEVA